MEQSNVQTVGRLMAFLDASVAIALTLLILPLMEGVTELSGEDGLNVYLEEHGSQFTSLSISFAVIALFWFLHHSILREDTPYSFQLGAANMAWLFTIVLMPITTALTGALGTVPSQVALYIGIMAASAWCLVWVNAAARQSIRRHGGDPGSRARIAGTLATALMYTVSGVIGVAIPSINYFALFLMSLTSFVARPLAKALGARDKSAAQAG